MGPESDLSRTAMQKMLQSRHRDIKIAPVVLYTTNTSRSGLLILSLHPHGIASQETCSFIPLYLGLSHSWTRAMLPTNLVVICTSHILLDLQDIEPYQWLKMNFHFFKQCATKAWKGRSSSPEHDFVVIPFRAQCWLYAQPYSSPPNTTLKFIVNNIV